eukprot:2240631-Prymnesium_polylepis.1
MGWLTLRLVSRRRRGTNKRTYRTVRPTMHERVGGEDMVICIHAYRSFCRADRLRQRAEARAAGERERKGAHCGLCNVCSHKTWREMVSSCTAAMACLP